MAITAKFQADFSSFLSAIDKATVATADFGKGAEKVESTLNRMVDNFSGRKLIQEAGLMTIAVEKAGGVSTLTAKELEAVSAKADEAAEKLKKLGYEVPAGLEKLRAGIAEVGTESSKTNGVLQGLQQQLLGMFSVGAVIAFGKEVLDAGDKIQKMADQTGLSIGEVQKLNYIAGQSGTSIESLIGSVQNLQVRLGDENSGAAGAFAKLGIEVDAFQKLGTYEQMTTLGEAIKTIHDPTEQASVAAALFGKTWKEILPAIKSGMQETGDQATIMADDTVKSLDRIGDTLKAARQAAIAWGGTFVTAIEGSAFAVGNFLSTFNPAHFGVSNTEMLKLAAAVNDPDGLYGALSKLPPAAKDVGEGLKSVALNASTAAGVTKDLTRQAEESITEHKKQEAQFKKNVEALKKFNEAMKELDSAGKGFRGTVDGINGEVVAAVRYYLQAGVAQNTLATAYGLTETQIKAIVLQVKADEAAQKSLADTLKEVQKIEDGKNANSLKALEDLNTGQAKANKQQMDDTLKSLDATEKLWVNYYDKIDAETLSSTDYKKLKVQEWFDDEVLKLKADDENWMGHYDALYATAQQKMDQIEKASNPYFQDMKKFLSDLQGGPGGWEDTFAKTLATTHSFKDAAGAIFKLLQTDIEKIFADMLANLLQGFFAPLEAKIGGILAKLAGIGSGSSLPGWLLALLGGGGGDPLGSTPITSGHFDPGTGLWVPDPAGGGETGGSEPPDVENPNEPHEAEGGVIPAHMRRGGRVFPGRPLGRDTVPIWAQAGEGVVTVRGMASLGERGLTAINQGGLERLGAAATAGGGFGGGGVFVQNTFHIAADVDSPAARERVRRVVDQATMAALRRQKRTNVA